MEALSILIICAPLFALGVIYLLRNKLSAIWSRCLTLTALTPVFIVAAVLLVGLFRSSSGELPDEDADSLGLGIQYFLILLTSGFVYLLSLITLLIGRQQHFEFIRHHYQQNKTHLAKVGLAVVVLATMWSLGTVITKEADPQYRLQKSAAQDMAKGHCAKATEKYQQEIELFEGKARSYGQWAKAFITCSDKSFRDSAQAIELVQKATEFGDFDNELAKIAVCAFSANGNFDRASRIAQDNNLEPASTLPELQKNCYR
ncbi:hypothetical protein [Bdellovibrio sp. HCB209]|uniref:hypothetical protein n=1 Tax=Bdellovibrio sp. HCB209 TaxID=3394354 RepID=UPI0039B57300